MTKRTATAICRLAASTTLVAYCVLSLLLTSHLAGGEEARIKGTPTNDLAESVLHDVLTTPLGKTLPPLRWEFFLIDDDRIAASSDGAGKIFVTAGMVRWYLGRTRGMWAAVLSHEMGHALLLHPPCWQGFQAELRGAKQQAFAGRHPQPATEPLLSWSRREGVFNVRNPKQREYAADCIAMLLMAEAGYHPEYALVLDRWFSGSFYDPARFVAWFTSHPRWKDREAHARQSYDVALAIFNSHWPDAAQSPGGIAPPAGKLGRVTAQHSPEGKELLIHVPFSLVKAEGVQARVAAVCLAGRKFVRSKDSRFSAPDGSLELNDSFPGSASVSREVSFRLPVTALDTQERKLRLVVFLTAGDLVLDVRALPIEVTSAKN